MTTGKYISVLLLCAALTGCGRFPLRRTPAAPPEPEPAPVRMETADSGTEAPAPAPRDERGKDESCQAAPAPEPVRKPEYPTITFSATESANVRVPGNNPLPSDGLLVLPLCQMGDDFCFPYRGKVISQYGRRGRSMHTGVDIKAIPGDTIRAAFPGVVRMSKYYSGYGNIVVIRHYNGIETAYAHCKQNLVDVNDVVEAGTPVGLAGRTGRATTEHLHFELRAANEHINPDKLLDYENLCLRNDTLYIRRGATGSVLAYNSSDEGRRLLAAADKPAPSAATAAPATGARSPAATGSGIYVIRKGDTLSSIAARYGTTAARLSRLNNITDPRKLQIGQKIKLP